MKNIGLINKLVESFKDKRKCNKHIPLHIIQSIHILDCTKIQVNLDNANYENSEVVICI